MAPSSLPVARRQSVGAVGVALVMRLVLFAAFQAVVTFLLASSGSQQPFAASAAWWPFTAAATSVATFGFLLWRGRVEGFDWVDLYRPVRSDRGRDVRWTLVVAVVGGTLAVAGAIVLAPVFFDDPLSGNALLIQPLPVWAAVVAIGVFPITVALTQLPLYFGYAQPRIAELTGSAWAAVVVPSLFLSLQHATLPLILDPAFIAWRGLMFVGFALVLGWALWKRPRLLPYLVVVHFLLDTEAAVSILLASVG